MSEINVSVIRNEFGTSGPTLDGNTVISGILTATSFKLPNGDDVGGGGATGVGSFDSITVSGVSTFAGNINANGDIVGDSSTNITGIAGVTATTLTGTLQTAAQTNITSLGTLSDVTVSGDVNANGNIVGDSATNITGIAGVTASTLTGTLQTAAQTNITSVGTLSSLDVSGNVSIGGTLTYEDVTNIDSVGVITARTGIKVLSDGIDAVGVVTATSFSGDGSNLTNLPSSAGILTAIASGTLADGSTVIVNSDSTVSIAGLNDPTQGGMVLLDSGPIYETFALYIQGSNSGPTDPGRVCVAYRDSNNSNYGTIIMGTISGFNISFGTPVVFYNASVENIRMCFEPTVKNVSLVFNPQSSTQIRFCVFEVGNSGNTLTQSGSTTLSSLSGTVQDIIVQSGYNVVMQYIASGNLYLVGATVTNPGGGFTLTFGSPVLQATSQITNACVIMDDATTRFVNYFTRSTDTYQLKQIISNNAFSPNNLENTIDSANCQFPRAGITTAETPAIAVVVYKVLGVGNKIAAQQLQSGSQQLNIDGNTVATWSTKDADSNVVSLDRSDKLQSNFVVTSNEGLYNEVIVKPNTGAAPTLEVIGVVTFTADTGNGPNNWDRSYSCFVEKNADSTPANKTFYAFLDDDGAQSSYALMSSLYTTNLTGTNFIGISNGAYTNGQTASIQTIGGIDDAQTGLTPGLEYFVQNDGSLSTTTAEPSVRAGTAVSPTQIIVKG